MADRDGPPTPDSMMCLTYQKIVDTVGTHDAAFNAMTRLPLHMLTQETPQHLLIAATLLALIDNDFSNLRAKEGTYWFKLCRVVSQHCRRMIPTNNGHTTDSKYLHLQTDFSTVPRLENPALDDALWPERDQRGGQIRNMITNMKKLPYTQRDAVLGPTDRAVQVKLDAGCGPLSGGIPASSKWNEVAYTHGVYLLNAEYNVTLPLGASPDYHHEVQGIGQTDSFVKDADDILNFMPPSFGTLARCLELMGSSATDSDSPRTIMRNLRRQLKGGTLSRAEPPSDWLPKSRAIIALLREARLLILFKMELSNRSNQRMWEQDVRVFGLEYGGPCHPDHPPDLTAEEQTRSRALDLMDKPRERGRADAPERERNSAIRLEEARLDASQHRGCAASGVRNQGEQEQHARQTMTNHSDVQQNPAPPHARIAVHGPTSEVQTTATGSARPPDPRKRNPARRRPRHDTRSVSRRNVNGRTFERSRSRSPTRRASQRSISPPRTCSPEDRGYNRGNRALLGTRATTSPHDVHQQSVRAGGPASLYETTSPTAHTTSAT